MPYIPLEAHLPGITGLLEYRQDTAVPIRELTQVLMRGPSTLTEGERELIATIVSHRNECKFCATAHTAAADVLTVSPFTGAEPCFWIIIPSTPVHSAVRIIAPKLRASDN